MTSPITPEQLAQIRADQTSDAPPTWNSLHDNADSLLALVDSQSAEIARMREALIKARNELGCLFTTGELAQAEVHDSDVTPEPNEADRECIAAAFNVIRATLRSAP